MAKTTTPRLHLTQWSAGTDPLLRTDFDGDNLEIDQKAMIYLQGTLAARPAAGVEGRIYTVKGDGTAANNNRQFYDNGTEWVADSIKFDFTTQSSGAGTTALTVRAAAGATADPLRINTSGDTTTLFRVTASGVATNQATPGSSAGGYIGLTSAHDAAGMFISVATTKPVLVARGAASQVNPVLLVQDNTPSTLFSVSPSGNAYLSGGFSANALTATAALTAASVVSSASSDLKNALIRPVGAGDVGVTVQAQASQTANLLEYKDSAGARMLRVGPTGNIASNGKIYIGNNFAESSTLMDNTYANLTVFGTGVDASTPAVRIRADAAQTGNIFELQESSGAIRHWMNNSGSSGQDGNMAAVTGYIGAASGTPTPNFTNGVSPRFEVLTGGASGAYDDYVSFRHVNQDGTAVTRKVSLRFNLSSEANSTESAKWVGIGAYSGTANAGAPNLLFYAGGGEAARFDATKVLTLQNDLNLPSAGTIGMGASTGIKMNLYSDQYQIGIQSSSFYMRTGGNFYWYKGGTFSASQGAPGSGGELLGILTSGSDNRLTTGRLTLTDNAAVNTSTPTIMLGARTGSTMRMQIGVINAIDPNSDTNLGNLYLQAFSGSGGVLVLGASDTQVRLDSRTLWTGSNRVYWGSGVWAAQGGAPVQNDWFFDYSDNRIMVRNAANRWKVVADDSLFP